MNMQELLHNYYVPKDVLQTVGLYTERSNRPILAVWLNIEMI
jgi:hypothetical protein